MCAKAAGHSKETKARYHIHNIKNIFHVAPALPDITSYLHSSPPAILYLPPDPLTRKALFQDDLRDQTQGGPGVEDRAVEPQYRRDHLPQDRAGTTAGPGATRAPKTMKLTGCISAARCCGIMWATGRRGIFSSTTGPGRG